MNDQATHAIAEMTAAGIPRSLAPCFQEYDLERLDPTQHWGLLIERVLAYGDRRELRWLFDRYSRARISEWVQRLGARRLPWRMSLSKHAADAEIEVTRAGENLGCEGRHGLGLGGSAVLAGCHKPQRPHP